MLLTFAPIWLAAWTAASLLIGAVITVKVQRFIKHKFSSEYPPWPQSTK